MNITYREILFKGELYDYETPDKLKGKTNHEVEGGVYVDNGNAFIIMDGIFYRVKWCSVRQFTGLIDANGVKVFEGDLLNVPDTIFMQGGTHQVHFFDGQFITVNTLHKDWTKGIKNASL